jgi:hypothetical protein
MADLHQSGMLSRSLWSYNTRCIINEDESDNPLELDNRPGWRHAVKEFVDQGPYFCDSDDDQSHNDHRAVPLYLYHQSYCNLVIETLFDADGSGGAFLTEKTFKAIKFGQPFVIIGTAHSLHSLRQQGYRVFDHVIDNGYDEIKDNTQRWIAVREAIRKIRSRDMHQWFLECMTDVMHNQQVFASMQNPELNKIVHMLSNHTPSTANTYSI